MSEIINIIEQKHFIVRGDLASFIVRAVNEDAALLKIQLQCNDEAQKYRFNGKLPLISKLGNFIVDELTSSDNRTREVVYSSTPVESVTVYDIDLRAINDVQTRIEQPLYLPLEEFYAASAAS